MYVYIHYHLDECEQRKKGLGKTIFWDKGNIYLEQLEYSYGPIPFTLTILAFKTT